MDLSLCCGEGDSEWKDDDRQQGPFSPGRGHRSRREIPPSSSHLPLTIATTAIAKEKKRGDKRPPWED